MFLFGKKKKKREEEVDPYLLQMQREAMKGTAKLQDTYTSVQVAEDLLNKFKQLQDKYFSDLADIENKYKQKMAEYEQQIAILKNEIAQLKEQYMKTLEANVIEIRNLIKELKELKETMKEKKEEKKVSWW